MAISKFKGEFFKKKNFLQLNVFRKFGTFLTNEILEILPALRKFQRLGISVRSYSVKNRFFNVQLYDGCQRCTYFSMVDDNP